MPATLTGNTIQNTFSDGITLAAATNATVTLNTINGVQGDGMHIIGSGAAPANTWVSGNTVVTAYITMPTYPAVCLFGSAASPVDDTLEVFNNTFSNRSGSDANNEVRVTHPASNPPQVYGNQY